MTTKPARWRDERGLVGKFIVVWLLIVGLLGVAAVDFASIAFTTFRLSDIAASAAAEAASQSNRGAKETAACKAAEQTVQGQDGDVQVIACREIAGDRFSITVRKEAATLLVDQLDFLSKYGRVTRTESASPGAV